MKDYQAPNHDWFIKNQLTPPTTQAHGTDDDIRSHLTPIKPKTWRLEGNQLIGMTDWGELVQFIPTDYILEGTDESGLPKFRKLV